MSDDLEVQIEALSSLQPAYCGDCGRWFTYLGDHNVYHTICKRVGFVRAEEVKKLVKAHLDRDRKMKAELANSLKGLAVDIGSVRLELTSTKALDSPRLDFVQSELLKEAAKLEAADSKTEASE